MELLIVDDETMALQSISMAVDWNELGIEKVWTAMNIQDARDIIKEEQIDILLCDIELRGENGLYLVEWVHRQYPNVKCIMVTGHVNFEYTRRVLKLQVFDYLSKPIDERKLKEAIKNAILQRNKEQRESIADVENMEAVRVQFLRGLLNATKEKTREDIKNEVVKRGLKVSVDVPYGVIYFVVRKWNNEYTNGDRENVKSIFINTLQQEYLKDYRSIVQNTTDAVTLCIRIDEDEKDRERLKKKLEKFISYVEMYFLCQICFYVQMGVYVENLPETLRLLKDFDKCNMKYDKGVFFTTKRKKISDSMKYPDIKLWKILITEGKYKETEKAIKNYMDSEHFIQHVGPKQLNRIIKDYQYMLGSILEDKMIPQSVLFEDETILRLEENANISVQQCQEWMLACLTYVRRNDTEENKNVICVLCNYIDTHMDEEITRNDLAKLVFLSPDHITRIFKKAKGMTISDYILNKKMERAAYLLKNTEFSISYIASNAGYSNSSHFSNGFKKLYHITPSQYRKSKNKTSV